MAVDTNPDRTHLLDGLRRWLQVPRVTHYPVSTIEELLHTTCVKELKRYPVSRLFNRVENNSRECIEPLKVNVSAGLRESGTKKA